MRDPKLVEYIFKYIRVRNHYSTVLLLYSTVLYCTVYTVQYSTVLYSTVQYPYSTSTVQYCTTYSTVLYCTVLYSSYSKVLYPGSFPKSQSVKENRQPTRNVLILNRIDASAINYRPVAAADRQPPLGSLCPRRVRQSDLVPPRCRQLFYFY